MLAKITVNPRPSIRDVARRAGVSHTTASLALRNDARITVATRRRVEKAALTVGYCRHPVVADLMAQLRTLKIRPGTATMGFVTAWPSRDGWKTSPNHRRFFDGVEARARGLGYKIEVFWLREPGMTSRRLSQILCTRNIRGLILQSLPGAHGHLSLEWQHFACVAKGLTITRPRLHRVISSHYEDMRLAMHQLKRHGYRRPGLVLDANLDTRVDRAWLAAHLLHHHDLPARDRVPPLILMSDREAKKFARWFKQYHPEVVVFSGLPVPLWVAQLDMRVPDDVGLVQLDWSREAAPIAGVDADGEALGAAAVDLLVGQLQANEFGIPRHEKIVAVGGRWVPGDSLRQQVVEKVRENERA
jgi:LacI family transcriptional regulator